MTILTLGWGGEQIDTALPKATEIQCFELLVVIWILGFCSLQWVRVTHSWTYVSKVIFKASGNFFLIQRMVCIFKWIPYRLVFKIIFLWHHSFPDAAGPLPQFWNFVNQNSVSLTKSTHFFLVDSTFFPWTQLLCLTVLMIPSNVLMEIKKRHRQTSGVSLKHCPETLIMGLRAG